MSREIKFRIWNTNGKTMHEWNELVEKNKIHLLANQNQAYPVMQYTGLKDKNGIEIYEGDIVIATAISNEHHQKGAKEVFFVREFMGSFCLCFKGVDRGMPIYPICVNHTLEVIGNIYENPELLK